MRAAAACWLIAGVVYVGLEAIAARAVPGYRYADRAISDLGQADSPLDYLMNTAFVVQGTLFLAGAVLLVRATRRSSRSFVGLAAANFVGNLLVAAVPSGQPAVAWVHLTGATLAIVGGNAAALVGSSIVADRRAGHYRPVAITIAGCGLSSFALLAVGAVTSSTVVLPFAVWERLSVYTIIGWQMFSAVKLLRRAS